MDTAELRRLLNAGIDAIRRGEREEGCGLLLAVVEADPAFEPAWLWLGEALETPASRLAALENALALNPANAAAASKARALRLELGMAAPERAPTNAPPARTSGSRRRHDSPQNAPPAGTDAWADSPYPSGLPEWLNSPRAAPAAQAPPPIDLRYQEEDDPDQCAYCGRPTDPKDTRCRSCRRGLLVSRGWRGGGYLFVILILAGLQMQMSVVQAVLIYLQVNYPASLDILPGESIWGQNVLGAAIARVALWGLVLLLLVNDAPGGAALAGAAGGFDLAWAVAGMALGLVSAELSIFHGLLAAALLMVGGAAFIDRSGARVRLRVVLDPGLTAGMSYAQRAAGYAQRGQWALAALHWRKAIAMQPRQPDYYKALGQARARLRRRDLALEAFRSGAEVEPGDAAWQRLIDELTKRA